MVASWEAVAALQRREAGECLAVAAGQRRVITPLGHCCILGGGVGGGGGGEGGTQTHQNMLSGHLSLPAATNTHLSGEINM